MRLGLEIAARNAHVRFGGGSGGGHLHSRFVGRNAAAFCKCATGARGKVPLAGKGCGSLRLDIPCGKSSAGGDFDPERILEDFGLGQSSASWDEEEDLNGNSYGQRRNALSMDHRKAISKALKGKKKPPGFMSDVHKAKIKASQSVKKKPANFMDDEHKRKISQSMKEAWKRRKSKKEEDLGANSEEG
mmetsp:Transcript_1423/g.3138  ORF Transcript_1423/g.3138 Transcript_1423/m.3138 type:complete len:188 (-) Transcript_1423:226-789(-)